MNEKQLLDVVNTIQEKAGTDPLGAASLKLSRFTLALLTRLEQMRLFSKIQLMDELMEQGMSIAPVKTSLKSQMDMLDYIATDGAEISEEVKELLKAEANKKPTEP